MASLPKWLKQEMKSHIPGIFLVNNSSLRKEVREHMTMICSFFSALQYDGVVFYSLCDEHSVI